MELKVSGVIKLGSNKYIYPGTYTDDNMPDGLVAEYEAGSTAVVLVGGVAAKKSTTEVGVTEVRSVAGAPEPAPVDLATPKKSAAKKTATKK